MVVGFKVEPLVIGDCMSNETHQRSFQSPLYIGATCSRCASQRPAQLVPEAPQVRGADEQQLRGAHGHGGGGVQGAWGRVPGAAVLWQSTQVRGCDEKAKTGTVVILL